MAALLLFLLTLPPVDASRLVERVTGTDVNLVGICERESAGQWIDVHPEDAWMSQRARREALDAGYIHAWCPFTWTSSGWSTRGPHGQVAAFSMRFLGPCAPPSLLSVPVVSAWVAVQRAEHRRCSYVKGCREWRSV
jgi:hypothetical protein